MRQRGPVTLRTGFPLVSAWRANLLEENETELPHHNNSVTFSIKPYQIVTLRLLPRLKV
jgi:alpha-mannosidase